MGEQTMNRVLNIVFLRLYGFNLGRGFRNAPHQACADALMQIVMLLVLPLLVVLCLLASLLRGSDFVIHLEDLSVVLFAAALVPPLTLWTVKQFSHYKNTPDAASSFRSTRERYKSVSVFALVLILVVVAAELLHYKL
jgi:predicted MFS family arabinose efflux permease